MNDLSRVDCDADAGNRKADRPEVSWVGRGDVLCVGSPGGDGRNGVNECLERRLDLVADGNGVLSTPPRLARGACAFAVGVRCAGRAEKPSSTGEGIDTC